VAQVAQVGVAGERGVVTGGAGGAGSCVGGFAGGVGGAGGALGRPSFPSHRDIAQERAEARLAPEERFELAFELLDQCLRVTEGVGIGPGAGN